MDQSFILFAVLLFVAVVLALEGAFQAWSAKHGAEAKRLMSRMRGIDGSADAAPLSIERIGQKSRFDWLDQNVVRNLPTGDKLVKYIATSGVAVSAGEMMVLSGAFGAAGAFLLWVLGKPFVFSVVAALVLGVLPWFWLARRRNKRIALFERQIPEALDLMGRALRAGHAFPTAVKMVGDEMPEPIAREFRVLFDESNFGVPQNEAMIRLADRVPVDDLRYFVIAVMIQRESGGNLAELLDNIAYIVRARLKLLGEVRVLSAEGKLSAWILGLLPFAVGGVINLMNPKFMSILWTDPAGLRVVGFALLAMVVGVWWMSKIIKIRV